MNNQVPKALKVQEWVVRFDGQIKCKINSHKSDYSKLTMQIDTAKKK